MAITKIWPIKSTLKKALDYVENPDKTDDKLLVSSYACAYETADIEFEMLLSQAIQKGNNLAHHLVQAFEPGETTPEQAHEIGRQLADEVLQGKYPYVLTTHIDKGHIHNHIVFCAVDMVNQRKYISNKQSYAFIRRTNDRLCKENGLSVVKPGRDKGKTYAEWDAQRKGTSWKAKLKAVMDSVIPLSSDFDDFLRRMEAQGYEIKRGKYISFRAQGQERFTRCKTLGEAYTEDAITERIKGRPILHKPKQEQGISLLIDIQNSIKAQQSAGYERWAKLHNLKQAAKTLNFITEHKIDTYADLESTYKQTRPIAAQYRRAKDKDSFRQEHESSLILYEAAARALKETGVMKLPDLTALKTEYTRLSGEKERLYEKYGEVKKELKEYGIIKQNVDGILRVTPEKERTQEL